MTRLYTIGLLLGTAWRAHRGTFSPEWFLVAVAGMGMVYLLEETWLKPFLHRQAREQRRTDLRFGNPIMLETVAAFIQETYRLNKENQRLAIRHVFRAWTASSRAKNKRSGKVS